MAIERRRVGCADPFLGQQGYRVVAHDRRGHGRSEQTWAGNDYDTFADDFAELLEKLDLKDVTLVSSIMDAI
jgi:non-heme chloroperoxidase